MLENIRIQNFRCFEDFTTEGFERVNLIGGMNNSGKTCLLEGIFLACQPNYTNYLVEARRDTEGLINNDKEKYVNLIHNRISSNPIVFSNKEFPLLSFHNGIPVQSGFILKGLNPVLIFDKHIQIPQTKSLTELYNDMDRDGLSANFLETLKIIDSNILGIKTYSDIPIIYLEYKLNSKPVPITLFGDAIQKIARYAIAFYDNKSNKTGSKVILIDEIENGLHYTAHEEFWMHIFNLSKELNVQVFATTHSLEMIKAFNQVSKKENIGAYFEMSREYESGKIFAFKHDIELLEYALTKETSTIRG